MNINKAETLARNLMGEHGLLITGWTFRFSRGRNQFGACRIKQNHIGFPIMKEITLSKKLSEINDETEVRDTILHEIAHAKAGHRAGHGPIWKSVASSIGARPVARFSTAEVTVSYKWVGTCADCNKQFKRHRVTPRSQFTGSRHAHCSGKEHNGHVEWKEVR